MESPPLPTRHFLDRFLGRLLACDPLEQFARRLFEVSLVGSRLPLVDVHPRPTSRVDDPPEKVVRG